MSETKHVFMSHSHEDHKLANQLVQALEKAGVPCWIAPRDIEPGKEYAAEIMRGIERAHTFVVLLSEKANVSRHVRFETEAARTHGAKVVPVRLGTFEIDPALRYLLGATQWIDSKGDDAKHWVNSLIGACRPEEGLSETLVVLDTLKAQKRLRPAALIPLGIVLAVSVAASAYLSYTAILSKAPLPTNPGNVQASAMPRVENFVLIWWEVAQATQRLKSVDIDFRVENPFPVSGNLAFCPLANVQCSPGVFVFGYQTMFPKSSPDGKDGPALYLSRELAASETSDEALCRPAPGGWHEVGNSAYRFIGVRRSEAIGTGKFRMTLSAEHGVGVSDPVLTSGIVKDLDRGTVFELGQLASAVDSTFTDARIATSVSILSDRLKIAPTAITVWPPTVNSTVLTHMRVKVMYSLVPNSGGGPSARFAKATVESGAIRLLIVPAGIDDGVSEQSFDL